MQPALVVQPDVQLGCGGGAQGPQAVPHVTHVQVTVLRHEAAGEQVPEVGVSKHPVCVPAGHGPHGTPNCRIGQQPKGFEHGKGA